MANELAPANPAEALAISPEGLEVANTYLELQDIPKTAMRLGIETSKVSEYLRRREIKAYIDHVFLDFGYNNSFRLRSIMDTVIEKKLQEMEEADIGSSKDITEILALSHKMSMELLDKQIKLATIQEKNNIKTQTNVQINAGSGNGTNYDALLNKLMNGNK